MSSVPPSEREYRDDELAALRLVGMTHEKGRGAAYYATGDYWPRQLRENARQAERSIVALRLAADAMEREIARWPVRPVGSVQGSGEGDD